MKKIAVINKCKASKLYKNFQQINQPGSGIVRYTPNSRYNEQLDISSIACTLNDLTNGNINEIMQSGRSIAFTIQQQNIQTLTAFQEYFQNIIIQQIEKTQERKKCIKTLIISWNQNIEEELFVGILRYLQLKQFCITISLQIKAKDWQNYQRQLANFSFKVLQQEHLVLSAISVTISLPQIESEDYVRQLLSIWRRVIPAELGRIIIQDWLQAKNKQIVGQLFYVKQMPICWQMQFITSDPSRCEKLGEQVLGLL